MVSVVGIFPAPVEIPLHELCLYGVKISMGLGSPSANDKIMGLVEGGRIQPGPLATHVFPLDSAIEAYELFEYHKEDCVKVLLEP
jgi:alcohol dehydrogenase